MIGPFLRQMGGCWAAVAEGLGRAPICIENLFPMGVSR